MILLGSEIKKEYEAGKIHISPFNEAHLGPNSYDVTLGSTLLTYETSFSKSFDRSCLDPKKQQKTVRHKISKNGFLLAPNRLYLGHTNEEAGSSHFLPMYEGRSSMARLGIQSHLSAGFGDVGFDRQWTLEITVVHPTIVYPDMRIGQVYFVRVNPDEIQKTYSGKYTKQTGPQASMSWKDWVKS